MILLMLPINLYLEECWLEAEICVSNMKQELPESNLKKLSLNKRILLFLTIVYRRRYFMFVNVEPELWRCRHDFGAVYITLMAL